MKICLGDSLLHNLYDHILNYFKYIFQQILKYKYCNIEEIKIVTFIKDYSVRFS